jgi:hypothetical protein
MKILFKLLLIGLVFSSCENSNEKDCVICELQGDWIGEEDEGIMIIYQNKIVEDQPWLIKYLEPFRIQENEIIIDSIRFRKSEGIRKYRFDIRYKIDYFADDTLRLIKYGIADSTEKKVIRLERLNSLYQYDFKKLSISSSPCYGSCPVFQIEIDSIGNVKFQSGIFTNAEGNYLGKIDKDKLDLIQTQIDKVDWDELDKSYWTETTDAQYFNVEMEDKKNRKYYLTTNSPKSKAVNILIFRIFRMIEDSKLEKTREELKFATDLKDN